MGYDVHITRAEDWAASEVDPIQENEWIAVVNSDPTLQFSDEDYYDTVAEDGSLERHLVVLWLSHPDKPYFWYMDGEITKKNPDEPTLQKMAEIAQKLNARVVGDEGEELDTEELSAPVEGNQRAWWQKLFNR